MKATILNYNVIIKKEKDKNKVCYSTYVPSLGIADYGDTIDEALKCTTDAIKLQVEKLINLKESIPQSDTEAFMTTIQVEFEKPIESCNFAKQIKNKHFRI